MRRWPQVWRKGNGCDSALRVKTNGIWIQIRCLLAENIEGTHEVKVSIF